jgi:hypothetical protein
VPRKPFVRVCASVLGLALVVSLDCAFGQEVKAAVSTPLQPGQLINTLKVTNIVPDFLSFWAAAESKDETTQIRMFRQIVMQPHPELFVESVVNLGQKQGTEEENHRIAAYLKQIPPLVPVIRVLNDRLQADLQTYIPDFARVFPDYLPSTPVYFTISLGHFNGAAREVGGQNALLFGVDVIARDGPDARVRVLFDHELFHQYHASLKLPQSDDAGQLWQSLWAEGLATYVSWRMNPSADENDVLFDETLAGRARPLLPALAADLLRNLRSKDPDEYDKYFLGNGTDKNIPGRSGYFVGFLVASRLGQSSTPLALAHLHGPELRSQIEQVLRDLSTPPLPQNR